MIMHLLYPMFDSVNGGIKALYPLRPMLVEAIIDDYISFSNKMQGKATLSAAEKIIQEQLKK